MSRARTLFYPSGFDVLANGWNSRETFAVNLGCDVSRFSSLSLFQELDSSMSKGYGKPMVVDVVIPALVEEGAVAQVVRGLIRTNLVRDVWVVDNGSTDATARCAEEAGAG